MTAASIAELQDRAEMERARREQEYSSALDGVGSLGRSWFPGDDAETHRPQYDHRPRGPAALYDAGTPSNSDTGDDRGPGRKRHQPKPQQHSEFAALAATEFYELPVAAAAATARPAAADSKLGSNNRDEEYDEEEEEETAHGVATGQTRCCSAPTDDRRRVRAWLCLAICYLVLLLFVLFLVGSTYLVVSGVHTDVAKLVQRFGTDRVPSPVLAVP